MNNADTRGGGNIQDVESISVDSGTDVILALLYAAGRSERANERISGMTRLEKLLFLLKEEGGFGDIISRDFEFQTYHYGPYSAEVYDVVEMLKDAGLVETRPRKITYYAEVSDADEVIRDPSEPETNQVLKTNIVEDYRLTTEGQTVGKALFRRLSERQREHIERIKSHYNSMTLEDLLRYVYKRYPEASSKSKIRNSITK